MTLNLNGKQVISIIGAVVSALMVATSQLTDLFGAGVAKEIVSASALGNMILQSVMISLTGQGNTVRDVLDMPGVEHINVNGAANQTLAEIAMDPSQIKISPTDAARDRVTQTANNHQG